MTVAALKEKLQSCGIQASAARLAVADFVLHTNSHPTADEVKEEVEKRTPSVSLATIYNTLNLFVEKGLIKTIRDPRNEKFRYDCNTQPHFHFYDEITGQMMDLDPREVKLSTDYGDLDPQLEVREVDIVLRGRRKKSFQER